MKIGSEMAQRPRFNSIANAMIEVPDPDDDEEIRAARTDEPPEELVVVGEDYLESEDLTDRLYSFLLDMMPENHGWGSVDGANKKEFELSDIYLAYKVGPYIPCTPRYSFTREVDLKTDGMPGIRIAACLRRDVNEIYTVRPVLRLPNDIQIVGRCVKRFKFITMRREGKRIASTVDYFGINAAGRIVPACNKRLMCSWVNAAYTQVYSGGVANIVADARYLWLAETREDVGISIPMHMRLGLNKEHVKSLFYARSLPVTETGRKRPILHWVHAHQRRIREGIDVDVRPHLRGITEFEMDGLQFRITQPNKEALQRDPDTAQEVMRLYA